MDRIIRVRYTATVGDLASRLQAFALAGPFKTGEPTREISESAIKRHKAGMMLSSESRNQWHPLIQARKPPRSPSSGACAKLFGLAPSD
jgi:hypothetical protein